MEFTLALAVTGFAVGLIVGMTGVGGGSLMTPALVGLFRIHPALAVGTDLAFAALTRAIGTGAQASQPGVDRRVVTLMLCGSLPAVGITLLALRFDGLDASASGALIRCAIGVSLALTVVALLWGERLLAWRSALPPGPDAAAPSAATLGAAAAIGALVALSSIGAGAIGCLVIALLHPRLDTRAAAATSVACAVPLTALAAAGHALVGNLDPSLLVNLLVGSVPGIVLGARLSVRLPEPVSRRVLAGALAVAAVRTVA